MLQDESGVVGMESVFVFEDGGGNRTRRRGWESVPKVAFDARGLGKMLARVLVGKDAGSGLMDPLVAPGVVEVPVGVDQLLDRIGVDACDGLFDVWTGSDDFGIYEDLSIGAGENGDISTSAQEDTYISSKVLNRDFRCGGFFERSL